MRVLFCIFSFVSLGGCTSMGGVLSPETTWFQDWSCERQDGVCARTDTIDAITISELDSDPAEAGPVSGYPAERLPLSANPKKLRGIQPLDQDYFDAEIDRGRPFLETSFGDEELLAAPAILSEPGFTIDGAFDAASASSPPTRGDPFLSAFPEAAIDAQFAVLETKMGLAAPEVDAVFTEAETSPSDAVRITRTIVRRDGVLVPEEDRVTELVSAAAKPKPPAPDMLEYAELSAAISVEPPIEIVSSDTSSTPEPRTLPNGPRRSPAKVLPVVISPYVDARGIYHERSVIWVEVEPADWVVD